MTLYVLYDLSDLSREDYFEGEKLEDRFDEIEQEILDEDGNIKPGSDPELVDERKALKDIIEYIEGYAEDNVRHTTLYRDSYFPAFAEEFASDVGLIGNDTNRWPLDHIDWKAAAEDLKQDYTSVEINGVDFWFR